MTEHNRDWVHSTLDRLRESAGGLTVERVAETVPEERFVDAQTEPIYRGSAYAWVVRDPGDAPSLSSSAVVDLDNRRRVLLHFPRGSGAWGLPGGGIEGDESHEQAARREVREETGVDCEIDMAWHAIHRTYQSESPDDPDNPDRTHALHVFFDATYTGGHISIQPGESNGAAWFADLPDDVQSPIPRRRASWNPTPARERTQ